MRLKLWCKRFVVASIAFKSPLLQTSSVGNFKSNELLIRGGAQYSKLGDLNDPGSLRVRGSEGRDVLDHYHNVIH